MAEEVGFDSEATKGQPMRLLRSRTSFAASAMTSFRGRSVRGFGCEMFQVVATTEGGFD